MLFHFGSDWLEPPLYRRKAGVKRNEAVSMFGLLGAVVCYSADFSERGREIAEYVDKILKGAKPADLPVQEPDNFELVVNLTTRLGLTLPRELLARADEVIE